MGSHVIYLRHKQDFRSLVGLRDPIVESVAPPLSIRCLATLLLFRLQAFRKQNPSFFFLVGSRINNISDRKKNTH